MMPDEKIKCPATAFKRTCRSIIAECECPKFVSVKFRNPQSGELVDKWGCSDSFVHLLLIENAQMSRQTGAAVEGFRNEVVKAEQDKQKLLSEFSANRGIKLVPSGN